MNKPVFVVLSIIVLLVVFMVGGAIGILCQKQIDQTQQGAPQTQTISPIVKELTPKVVVSISAFGTVTKIDGRKITLTNAGDTLTVNVQDKAPVYSFSTPLATKNGQTVPLSQTASTFENIKVGDRLNASSMLLPDGTLQARSVIIMNSQIPPAPAAKQKP